jgi:phage tail-like protein
MRTTIFVPLALAVCALGSSAFAAPPAAAPKEPATTIRVKWDNRVIPGITYVGPLTRRTEAVESRSGGDPNSVRRSPGRTTMAPLVLRRPRTTATEFEQWAGKVWKYNAGLGSEVSLADFRKNLILDVMDATASKVTAAYFVYRCWPAEYTPVVDATADNPAGFEVLTLACEGYERDANVR